jgi:hypothetical protein
MKILKVHTSENMNDMFELRIMYGVQLRGLGRNMKLTVTCLTHFVINYLDYQGGYRKLN